MLPVQTVRILNGTCSRPTFLLMFFVYHFRLSSRLVSRNCPPRRSFSQNPGRRAGLERRRIVILTGAGLSNDAVLDTSHDPAGLSVLVRTPVLRPPPAIPPPRAR